MMASGKIRLKVPRTRMVNSQQMYLKNMRGVIKLY